jgi:N-acetylglucosamine-6-phosphate deacetylase
MLKAVKNCVQQVGLPLEEALRMASLYPARVMRMDQHLGKIEAKFDAELLWLNDKIELMGIYTRGSFLRL